MMDRELITCAHMWHNNCDIVLEELVTQEKATHTLAVLAGTHVAR